MTERHLRFAILLTAVALFNAACSTNPLTDVVLPPPQSSEPAPAPGPPSKSSPAATDSAPDKSALRITISAVGDMMIGTDYPANHLPDDDGVGFFAAVTDALSSADITFGNLEGVLLDGGEPGKQCSDPRACYLFRSPTRYIEHFRRAGFDVLSLANNHARDFGEEGRSSSMRVIAAAGLHHSGRVGDFASFNANDLRIALLAYAVTRNSNLMLDYELAFSTVAECAATHDIVVVTFHGGAEGRDATHVPFGKEEYFGEPRGDVVWFARGVVDAGADLVLGHGPHVVRGMERYNDRLIAYSLGNFATYYGISVAGIKGIAPILSVTLDGSGVFVDGKIVSTTQLRPAGPSIDSKQRALNLIRGLSQQDFGNPGLQFLPNGQLVPVDRGAVAAHELVID